MLGGPSSGPKVFVVGGIGGKRWPVREPRESATPSSLAQCAAQERAGAGLPLPSLFLSWQADPAPLVTDRWAPQSGAFSNLESEATWTLLRSQPPNPSFHGNFQSKPQSDPYKAPRSSPHTLFPTREARELDVRPMSLFRISPTSFKNRHRDHPSLLLLGHQRSRVERHIPSTKVSIPSLYALSASTFP